MTDEIKKNKYTSIILISKALTTIPFYLVGIVEPSHLNHYTLILFIEAFHHFHARIFYLLTLYRCCLQVYFALFSDGYYQRRFIYLEVLFDVGLIMLYIHENFALHNIHVFYSKFLLMYVVNAILSLFTLKLTESIKFEHVV